MVETNNKYRITNLNEEKLSKTKKLKVEKTKSKSFIRFSIIKNAVIAISTYIISNPVTEFFTLRLQDVVGLEVYKALGERAFNLYSIISNAIIAEPTLLALGLTGISIVGDLVYITVKKSKELIDDHKRAYSR